MQINTFKKLSVAILIFLLFNSSDLFAAGEKNEQPLQINISILLDLSDRIDPNLVTYIPSQNERDIEIIKVIAEELKKDMVERGAYLAKGKLRVLFSPAPNEPEINFIAEQMSIDLSDKDPKEKKIIFKSLPGSLVANAEKIYNLAIKNAKWDGADLWRFFKNKVKDYCVDSNDSYRNILIILTDGYVYHKNSVNIVDNRSTYILPKLFMNYGLRGNPNWEEVFEKKDLGMISTRNDLKDLEVLVLEVNPSTKNRDDEDIIRKYLSKWFNEMGISDYKIYNTDLPQYTQKRVRDFLKNKY